MKFSWFHQLLACSSPPQLTSPSLLSSPLSLSSLSLVHSSKSGTILGDFGFFSSLSTSSDLLFEISSLHFTTSPLRQLLSSSTRSLLTPFRDLFSLSLIHISEPTRPY
eukprot:TRINITY_DN1958_c0_g2_i1.p1 TRINITY_DN1958_c0_g2~~TRINITY_DN1958_c0_g2_i1.p1  ORF type:complete len:108 (+),score=24.32 TRINITY_DN1958_c0_g2_i1:625-948(+)